MRFAAFWLSALLLGAAACAGPASAQDAGEIAFWNSVRESRNPAELKAYVDAYPQGKFVPLARLRIDELAGGTQVSPARPTVGSATAQAPGAGAALEWKEFRSADGNFVVLLPGAPEAKQSTPEGRTNRRFTVDLGGSVFIVDYSDYKPDQFAGVNPTIVLDRGQQGLLEGVNGKVRKTRSKTVAGYPGREVVFDTPDKNAGKIRMFLVNARLYQILFLGPEGEETKPEIRTFLDSFHLIKDPGPHAPPPVVVPAGSDWNEFRSAEGHFAVLFPGDPDVAATQTDVSGHSQHRFVVDKGDTAYMVSYDDYKPGTIKNAAPKTILDRAQDALLESMKGTLRQHRLLNVAGNQGREVVFDTPNQTTGMVRIYPARDRLYQVWYLGPSGQESRPEVERFLDSFTLVN